MGFLDYFSAYSLYNFLRGPQEPVKIEEIDELLIVKPKKYRRKTHNKLDPDQIKYVVQTEKSKLQEPKQLDPDQCEPLISEQSESQIEKKIRRNKYNKKRKTRRNNKQFS